LLPIAGPDAIAWSRRLAAEEGIFTGISGGASLAAAIQVAERAPEGSVLCCMLPDTGERYLSTPLFEGVATDMTPRRKRSRSRLQGSRCLLRDGPRPPIRSSEHRASRDDLRGAMAARCLGMRTTAFDLQRHSTR
jgi:hypothetical protein